MISHLLIGSNLQDRKRLLCQAADLLNYKVGKVIETSSIYETSSWGIRNLPPFLNQVVLLDTELTPHELLEGIKEIEENLGRKQRKKWNSREIDIDILFYGDEIIHSEKLTIPHPLLQDRLFALVPLLEVSPNKMHPVLGLSVKDMIVHCKDFEKVTLLEEV